jgi:lipoprotein-anchoring transpeptidase ErfK/SrfK
MTNRCTTAQSTEVVRRWAPPAIATLAATAALTALTAAPPADAAPRQVRPEHTTEGAAPRAAGEPIMAIVSIKSQKVTIYDADGWVLRAPVSSGTKGRETPAGVFSVVEKDKDHRSSLYDDAWMPHMLRITWNGIALHGGPLPGYAASHGCVRMPFGFAEKLFDKVHIGTRVIISPSDAEPVEFSHPTLFVPKSAAIAAAPARAETLAREADETTKLAQQTKNAAALAVKEAAPLTAALRKLELAKTRADAALAVAEKALAAAKTDQAKARAEDQKQKAAAKVEELQTQLDAAKANAKSKLDAAAAAQDAAKAAETKKADAAKAASEAKLALEPVSVFISRATQKLYVRRNTHKRLPDGARCSMRPLRFRSRSAIPTSRSARMCLRPWRAPTGACAGPRSRSTAGTSPRPRLTASPSRRMCSIGSRQPHCRSPRSSFRTSLCTARPTIARSSSLR